MWILDLNPILNLLIHLNGLNPIDLSFESYLDSLQVL